MKKLILAASGAILMSMATIALVKADAPAAIHHIAFVEWMKSKTGTWPGVKDGTTYWYKIDKNAKLWWSTDGKKWAAVDNGMWADKDGKWLKIGDGKLWWTADGGKNFSEVPDWKWEGSDGKWYKFDAKWSLWTNK